MITRLERAGRTLEAAGGMYHGEPAIPVRLRRDYERVGRDDRPAENDTVTDVSAPIRCHVGFVRILAFQRIDGGRACPEQETEESDEKGDPGQKTVRLAERFTCGHSLA
ncbi:hypothetical protein ACFR99_13300 [Haloarchaeobius amylolyticus]|uniref:Uncharacterized protein n=1 Tax=Haloarchaeobius amylolyticus TaxID=1198296 RepID=A0ABD6BIY7_9EURY